MAQQAGTDYLLITHPLPPVPPILEATFLADARAAFDGPVRMAADGTSVFLPVDSDDIVVTELLS